MKDAIHAASIPDCASGRIIQLEYWNLRRNYSGYWHKEYDVMNYLTIKSSGSVIVSS